MEQGPRGGESRKSRYRKRRKRNEANVDWRASESEADISDSDEGERVPVCHRGVQNRGPGRIGDDGIRGGSNSDNGGDAVGDNNFSEPDEDSDGNDSGGNLDNVENNSSVQTSDDEAEGQSGDSEMEDYEGSEPDSGEDEEADEENDLISESEDDPVTSDEEEDDVGAHEDGNQPIYPGAPITLHESVLAIFTLMSYQHLSGKLVALILKLIALHCPDGSIVKRTLFKFKQYFAKIGESIIVYHYFCSNCIYPLVSKNARCPKCKKSGNVSFFIELPLLNQLQFMFKRGGFYEDLQYRFQDDRKVSPDNIEDIYDGRVYRAFMGNDGFLRNPNNISFLWYSDGVSVFKSSKFSIWPLCLVINELPYKIRTRPENILLAGLWFGRSKPNPNLFLRPLKKVMASFESRGHKFKLNDGAEIRVKAKILCGTCDMPAKSLFLRFKQFNAYFGCPRCLAAGARAPTGKTTVQVYPFEANVESRSHQQTQEFADQALEERKKDKKASVYGVKGPSLLSKLVPDIIKCTAIDVMHGVYLGVCKLLMSLWFSSTFSNQPWSLHHLEDLVDAKMREIKPPSSVQRAPRSLKEVKFWKAAEFKMFFLYYSVLVFKGIMTEEYLKHHCLLVSGISLLSLQSISLNQIQHAAQLLKSYVSDFARLYSVRFLGINVHQLLHFADVVLDLGPLWVYSCFFLESFNGEISKLFHGTQHVALQICSSVSMFMQVPSLVAQLNPECKVYEFCHQLKNSFSSFKLADQIDHVTFAVGKYSQNFPHTADTAQVLDQCFNLRNGSQHIFYRLKKKATIFYSRDYQHTSSRRESSYVILDDKKLGQVLRYVRWSNCNVNCQDYCNNCPVSYYAILKLYDRQVWFIHEMENVRLSHMFMVKESENTVAVSVHSIQSLCIYMKVNDNEYLVTPVNTLEVE